MRTGAVEQQEPESQVATAMDGRAARRAVVRVARGLTGAADVSLFEPDESDESLRVTASIDPALRGYRAALDDHESLVIKAWHSREPHFADDLSEQTSERHRRVARARGSRAAFVVPLLHQGRPLAVLICAWRARAELTESQRGELADVAAAGAEAIARGDELDRRRAAERVDASTGVPDLAAWDAHLRRRLARHTNSGPLCVALLRVDLFADPDRTPGHGDDAELMATVRSWSADLRPGDFLARHGRREFGVVLEGVTLREALPLAGRLRAATPSNHALSIGIAEWDGIEPGHVLVRRADEALFLARQQGGDRTVLGD